METKGPVEELGALAHALVHEQRDEERRLGAIIEEQSLRLRKAEGLTWSPVQIQKQDYTFGGWVRLKLEKGSNGGLDDAFRSGTPVHFYQANEGGQPADPSAVLRGIVRKISRGSAEVILDGAPLSSADLHERWTLDERADDRSYRVMGAALNHWINTEDPLECALRDALLGSSRASLLSTLGDLPSSLSGSIEDSSETLGDLNAQQRSWVLHAESADQFAVLHGPPGTGKTTTVLAFVDRAIRRGERVLLCAPSNAAVDLLVKGCVEREISVIRLGHPMRMDDSVFEWGVDAQVERQGDFKQVKAFRKRAELAWKAANKFHRTFGAAERAERKENRIEARSLGAEASALENYIAERLIRNAPVVCATLVGSADQILKGQSFDWVVIDEAAQAMQPAAWIPIRKGKRVILAGDPMQLPPVVKSDEAIRAGLEVSLLERAMGKSSEEAGALPHRMLTHQYRMHPEIMMPASKLFYHGLLESADLDIAHRCQDPAFQFIDTAGCGFDEERIEGSHSTINAEEAQFVVARMLELLERHPKMTVGVIAPYRAQAEILDRIWKAQGADIGGISTDRENQIACSTVDAFQGQERDIIVISLTRSNAAGEIGFLKEYRRINVAMTRAKHHLLMIGDGATVGQDAFFESLLSQAESQGAYRSAWEWMQ